MSIVAKNKGGEGFDPIDAGTYFGRCFSMVHIGTREESINGKTPKKMNKVYITFEIPSETIEVEGEEKPRVVGKELTLSMNEKATLRKFLDAWRGKAFTDEEAEEFDVTKLIGVAAMITVVHKTAASGNVYVNITGVSKPPKGTKVEKQINPSFEFNYEDFAADQSIIEKVPEFIQHKIKESEEYAAVMNGAATPSVDEEIPEAGEDDEDLPF